MLNVIVDKHNDLRVQVAGCPEAGVDALDFRRAHGLPDGLDNVVQVPEFCVPCEDVFRDWPEFVHPGMINGDFNLGRCVWNLSRSQWKPSPVSPATLAGLLSDPAAHVRAFTAEVLAGWREWREVQKKEEAEEKAKAEARRKAADEEYAKNLAKQRANEAEAKAKAEARQKAKVEWIAAHGSDRLKRCLAEDIECDAIYRSEWMAHERPGWVIYQDVTGEAHEPRNPSAKAFATLDKAREVEPDARLMFYIIKRDVEDEYEEPVEESVWKGYVAIADMPISPDHDIVFGIPAEHLS